MPKLTGNNPANDPSSKPVKNHSMFKPNRSFYQSVLFGLNSPHFAMEVVEGDKLSVRCASDVDTLSLKAPVMTPINMHKDYFFVPNRAILPHNSDLLITNPLTGEDIIAENVNTVIKETDLRLYLGHWITTVNGYLTAAENAASTGDANRYLLAALIVSVYFIEPFASDGALLQHLGRACGKVIQTGVLNSGKYLHFDDFIEALVSRLRATCDSVTINVAEIYFSNSAVATTESHPVTISFALDSDVSLGSIWSLQNFLLRIRQGTFVTTIKNVTLRGDADTTLRGLEYDMGDGTMGDYTLSCRIPSSNNDRYLNYQRAVAYQLASVQFYTDDGIDHIYTCDLWHQNLRALFLIARSGSYISLPNDLNYKLNGSLQEYDSVSGRMLYLVSQFYIGAQSLDQDGYLSLWSTNVAKAYGCMGYINNIFGFTRSLKFRDYFCGSHKHPLAVGDTSVPVVNGQFDVVEVTRNIQIQRFLNQVNRVGRKLNDYVQGIFGTTPSHDPRTCVFLGSSSDVIGASEVENTGSDQFSRAQSVTAKFRKDSSQFAFEGSFAETGVVIGIVRFDAVRPYPNATDRQMFHIDRFDMFNPYLQQIGDQEVYGQEIDPTIANTFGYKLRYSEYKIGIDHVAGAFREFLPGFAFMNDVENFAGDYDGKIQLSPDFIRSRPTELDPFFLILDHYSAAGYAHFMIRHDLIISASRPMEAAPSIL